MIKVRPKYPSRNHEIVAALRESAGAGPPRDPAMVVKKQVAEIAIQMALLYGGEWKVRIDPENGLVQVARRRHPKIF